MRTVGGRGAGVSPAIIQESAGGSRSARRRTPTMISAIFTHLISFSTLMLSRMLLSFVLLAAVVSAAPLERDLGHGLSYYRIHELPADLPAKPPAKPQPRVIDVRYVQADAEAAHAWARWLKSVGTPRAPIFILANAETAAPLLAPLLERENAGLAVLIGAPGKDFRPQIPVQVSAEDERRAYDALESGTALTALLVDNPDKVRNDEASLSKDGLAEAAADSAADAAAKNRPPPPPVDAALQRAVHFHRTLVALKKL
jgi:hypothetical protein